MTIKEAKAMLKSPDHLYGVCTECSRAYGYLEGASAMLEVALVTVQPFIDRPYTSDTSVEAENIKRAILAAAKKV